MAARQRSSLFDMTFSTLCYIHRAPPPSLAVTVRILCSIQALKELERLPPQQYCTGWVLHQVGRAHFERADYANAKVGLL